MATKRDGEAVSMVLPSVKHDNGDINSPLGASVTKEVRHILTNISQKSTKADLFSSTTSTTSDKSILLDMEELIHRVADSNVDTEDISKTIDKIRNIYPRALRTMSERLEDSISAQSYDLATLADKINMLAEVMKSETMPQRKVLDSLYYAQMDERRNRVSRAHLKTFQWLFRHKSEDDSFWDDFSGWLISPNTHTVYWIRGKAGSGKSTLMRELDQKVADQRDFHEWTRGYEALHASSNLWNAGSVVQKSLTGLLLSLVYQLFQQRADLVEHSLSSERWQIALERGAGLRNWTDEELKQILISLVRQACRDAKILFLVDGLDEYDGDDQERLSMIVFLEALAAEDSVKICVSSRPWIIYKDAFKFCPQLWLEELTKEDISLYVHDHLLGSQLFRVQQQRHPRLLTNIADEIIQKAAGVFLWVRVVVQELLKRLRDGAFAAELLKQLHAIPPDLDDYFMRMMETIDQRYRQDASTMLQIALHRMDFTFDQANPDSKLVAGPDLLLLHFQYLDDEEAPNFVNSKDFRPLRYDDDEEVSFWIETLDRRLTSRCMGLLEANKIHFPEKKRETKVDFLHRTARDFMCTRKAQNILQKYTNGPYDAHMYRCNVLVADVMSLHLSFNTQKATSLLSSACFLAQVQITTIAHQPALFALYDKLIVYLETTLREATAEDGVEVSIEPRFDEIAAELLSNYKAWDNLPVILAKKIGWREYLESRISGEFEGSELLRDGLERMRPGTTPDSDEGPELFMSARSNFFSAIK